MDKERSVDGHLAKGSKRISRRQFLEGLVDITLYGGLGYVIGRKFYPFIGLLAEPEPGTIAPEAFADAIDTKDIDIYIEAEGHAGYYNLSLDKEEFSRVLYVVAKDMIPKDGPERVYSLLKTKHLQVNFDPTLRGSEKIGNDSGVTLATLTGYSANGPQITFYGNFLQEYFKVLQKKDMEAQKEQDLVIFHEITHFVQDIINPVAGTVAGSIFLVQLVGGGLKLVKSPHYNDIPYEKKAQEVSGKLMDTYYNLYKSGQNPDAWPFGRFFKFS